MSDMTGVVSVSIISRTVFGNKRIVIADLAIGDGADTLASSGIPFTPSELSLAGIDLLSIENASLIYKYDYSSEVIDGYTAHATPGATQELIIADQAIPNETVRIMAIGWGG